MNTKIKKYPVLFFSIFVFALLVLSFCFLFSYSNQALAEDFGGDSNYTPENDSSSSGVSNYTTKNDTSGSTDDPTYSNAKNIGTDNSGSTDASSYKDTGGSADTSGSTSTSVSKDASNYTNTAANTVGNSDVSKSSNSDSSSSSSSSASTSSSATSTSFDYIPMEKIPGFDATGDFSTYILAVYSFGIWTIGLSALLMIMIGGFMYITSAGNNASMEKAKGIITDAIIGVLMALSAYLILYVINPELVKIKTISITGTGTGGTGTGTGGTGNCVPLTSGPCSVENLTPYFGDKAKQAAGICSNESGGNTNISSGSDKCQPGKESVSWGLFQINLSAHKINGLNCPSAFSAPYTGSNHNCTITNSSLYQQCIEAAKNPEINIKKAVELSQNGNHWGQWGANKSCGYTP